MIVRLSWSPKYLDDCFWPFLIFFCFRSDLNSFLQMSLIVIVFRLHFQWQFLKWRIWNFRKLSSKDCLWLSYPIKCWSSRSGAASLPPTTNTVNYHLKMYFITWFSYIHNLAGGEARCRWGRAKFCVVAQFHFYSLVSIKSCEVHLHMLKTIGKRKHESNTC